MRPSFLLNARVNSSRFSFWSNQLIASSSEHVRRPYGLALDDHYLYWTEKDEGKIQRLSLMNSSLSVETLRSENRVLFDIKLFDNTSQTGNQTVVFNQSKLLPNHSTDMYL